MSLTQKRKRHRVRVTQMTQVTQVNQVVLTQVLPQTGIHQRKLMKQGKMKMKMTNWKKRLQPRRSHRRRERGSVDEQCTCRTQFDFCNKLGFLRLAVIPDREEHHHDDQHHSIVKSPHECDYNSRKECEVRRHHKIIPRTHWRR
jgi:hypothetical protein